MPKGVYERKPRDFPMTTESEQQMFPVVLTKNYAPKGDYQIIGYLKPEVKRKTSAGNWIIEEKEEFIEGEMKPPPHPGVGYPGKIWAGTHIRVPTDEAKTIIAKKIAERADAIAA